MAEPRLPPRDSGVTAARFDAPGSACDLEESSPTLYPDEYLFDGGDRGNPVHYDAYNRLGLEAEDTVAEFADVDGKTRVKPSNRVAIYAPRFGAVATISSIGEDTALRKVAGSVTNIGGNALRSRTGLTTHNQRLGTERMQTRLRPTGIAVDAVQHQVDQKQWLALNGQTLNVFENRVSLRASHFDQVEGAVLGESILAAQLWTRNENPTVAARTESASEIYTQTSRAEFVGTKKKTPKPGQVRVVKTADKKTAQTGDIINFTIRFENTGDEELRNVIILDNLTPRLEYVPDSARSDRDGQLVTDDNGEGSLILRWELSDPVPGHKGGVVGFQARVK